MTHHAERNRLLDQSDSFGWVSITLHWLTAALIILLWFVGRSIMRQDTPEAIDARRSLHITIALCAWLLLLARIIWRLRMHHPRASGQTLFIHRLARTVHYIMIAGVALMMVSGPAMAWSQNEAVIDLAYAVHSLSASVLLVLFLLHLGGTLKHLMFHEDDTIVRMLWPKKQR